ncbi:MAG TPA: AAC(3) family N-acetyltransferase [Terriglobales bacterium]|nr:AAC(3) family N-acetyltransferase [Terriglobales bacterium]
MLPLTRTELDAALATVGVAKGDGLLVHSALQFFGKPQGGLQAYLDALLDAIGSAGTLAVPTFPFTFNRGLDYDPETTPSKGMGVFSEFVRQQSGAQRTKHPMQSLAVIGAAAKDLTERDTLSAFDVGSAFTRMLELGFKLLLLGADVQAVSMIHYSEQRAVVPYRYWKDFSGRIKENGDWQTRTYRMFVRNLEIDPKLQLAPVQSALESNGQWHSVPLQYGKVSSCLLSDFVAAADSLLAADPWALVANKPESAAKN